MDMVRLAGVGLAAVLLGGAAWGQAVPRPSYQEALTAVTEGGCERTEAERYIRYYCGQSEALFYFTHEGRPEHEAYFVAPAYPVVFDRFTVVPPDLRRSPDDAPFVSNFSSGFGRGRPVGATSREESRERMAAWSAWQREIIEVSRADAERMQARVKRDRGRLYPLEPQ
ncbi:MAG TPA: hypothetical protein VFV70_12750 [Hyphomonadaceae bacterium]|nr:hypothetical protein [Hyphomonadaceae bacterium]